MMITERSYRKEEKSSLREGGRGKGKKKGEGEADIPLFLLDHGVREPGKKPSKGRDRKRKRGEGEKTVEIPLLPFTTRSFSDTRAA